MLYKLTKNYQKLLGWSKYYFGVATVLLFLFPANPGDKYTNVYEKAMVPISAYAAFALMYHMFLFQIKIGLKRFDRDKEWAVGIVKRYTTYGLAMSAMVAIIEIPVLFSGFLGLPLYMLSTYAFAGVGFASLYCRYHFVYEDQVTIGEQKQYMLDMLKKKE